MRIPDEKIEEVRRAAEIVEVISSTVALKKRGKSYLGLCPFHQEKTPSFSVSAEKQMFYCFGCGKGGNVFTFVMEHEKVSFIEAVRSLAERFGVLLPSREVVDQAQATEMEMLYTVCRQAAVLFENNLRSTVEGKMALEYFRHRGFTDATIRTFGLGYAMNGWDDLVKMAEHEHLDPSLLEKAGLLVRREDGTGYYDRFRGRAMFPILSTTGRTIAFGARKMREDDPLGKYINSPETPIYSKSRTLYGLYQAKEAIREKGFVVLVEGYADLISVFQGGIENIVASSGTALTTEQIQLLSRYTKTISLVYDADSAGSKATLRGVDLIIENDLDVRVTELPPGDDPDSFVRTHGAPAFAGLLEHAVSFLDFKAKLFQQEGLFTTPEGKARAVRSFVETIAKMKDELKRNFYIQHVAEQYGIYESVLHKELEKALGHQVTLQRSEPSRPDPRTSGPGRAEGSTPFNESSIPVAERALLKVMVEQGKDLVQFVFSHITPSMFEAAPSREILKHLLRYADGDESWDATRLLHDLTDPSLQQLLTHLLLTRHEISKGWTNHGSGPFDADPWQIARDSIIMLKQRSLDSLIADAYGAMKEAGIRGEDPTTYQQQIISLQQEKKLLREQFGKPAK